MFLIFNLHLYLSMSLCRYYVNIIVHFYFLNRSPQNKQEIFPQMQLCNVSEMMLPITTCDDGSPSAYREISTFPPRRCNSRIQAGIMHVIFIQYFSRTLWKQQLLMKYLHRKALLLAAAGTDLLTTSHVTAPRSTCSRAQTLNYT